MATSGRVLSSRPSYFAFYFQWQLASQNIGGNYSTINWQWGVNITGGGYLLTNAAKSVNGFINGSQVFGANTWSNISGSGDHQLLSGSFNVPHNGDGSKNFGISSTGWITGEGNLGNSGSWDLPTIPRHSAITNAIGNINDEQNQPWVEFSNPAGTAVNVYIELPGLGGGAIANRNNVGSRYTWTLSTTELNTIRALMANVNSATIRFVVHDSLGGDSWTWIDRTISIVNGNPVFTDFDYADTNSAVVAVTGNNQVLVQGLSTLRATIDSSDKMVPQKQATANKYTFSIDGISSDQAYSASTINKDLGTVANSGSKNLSVKAFDSRNNFTEVIKVVEVIPYAAPVVNATIARENGFEEQTSLNISGSYSRVVVGGTPKNSVSPTTGVRYRYKEVGGAFGSWVNKSATVNTSTGEITTSETLLSLDNNKEFVFEVEIIDALGSTVVELALDRGNPILWLGANRTVGINHIPDDTTEGLHIKPGDALWNYIYPVGAVVLRTTNTNPQSVFGGTWVATTTPSTSFLGQTVYGFKRTA